jgi:L-aspartate oxidase
MCGGVKTDTEGRTSLPGLYCAGETAYTGVHGANRLASNSLLEAVVFSDRAYRAAIDEAAVMSSPGLVSPFRGPPSPEKERVVITHTRFEIKRLMWDYVGIVRSSARLRRAEARMHELTEEVEDLCADLPPGTKLLELRNIAAVSMLVTSSANMREESRGLHYNKDFPERDDGSWKRDTILERNVSRTAG